MQPSDRNPNIPPSQSKIVPPYIPPPKPIVRTIPLHIADQAVAACEAEIQKLREENARLRKAGDAMAFWIERRRRTDGNPLAERWDAAKETPPHA